MDEQKQIEEMKRELKDVRIVDFDGNVHTLSEKLWDDDLENIATELYGIGYRKQSVGEWISIEERLPEPKKWVLVFTRHIHHPVVCFYEDVWYFLGGFFSKGQVTHWMPLPEPPDMKGGAE